jgi:Ricin-type beta-trefoil lectin domain
LGNVPLAGTYVFASRQTDMVMTVSGAAEGASVVQRAYTAASDQMWNLSATATPRYYSANPTSSAASLLLDVTGGTNTAGALLEQWDSNGGSNQKFTFTPYGDGRGFFTFTNLHNGMCNEVYDASTLANTNDVQWTCNSGTNEQWWLAPANWAVP